MHDILDLKIYPLDQPNSSKYQKLVEQCRHDLAHDGLFNLKGFLKPEIANLVVNELQPLFASVAFTHKRKHNIYFCKEVSGIASNHPALRQFETINHTLCADQILDNAVLRIYRYAPLAHFLAQVMEKPRLFVMEDPLACANVMAYGQGEALNWHFDRSEFTITLLLQAADNGGLFEYRSNLRTDDDPNYAGVARLINGEDTEVRTMPLSAGTLNVFRGKNTAHRVTQVKNKRNRMVAVFSYYDRPSVVFSDEERIGFYGRAI